MQKSTAVTVILALMAALVAGEANKCEDTTCSECIAGIGCAWCSNQNITLVQTSSGRNLSHCISTDSSMFEKFNDACINAVINPVSANETIEDNEYSDENMIQLKPQHIRLDMRAGDSARVKVQHKSPSTHPLDLYCLMDGSTSMNELMDHLSQVTHDLVNNLTEISSNIRLGFGTFVDKPILPYTDINLWKRDFCSECVETYSFKNLLPLTFDSNKFRDTVANNKPSTNNDIPEGLLEALMQVVSCEEQIGWRKNAWKVVVVFTDVGFHIAGDGRLAGIIEPNDRKCHLDDNGVYTHYEKLDYPSVSEIQDRLDDTKIYTVFAVKDDVLPLYKILTDRLPQSSCTAIETNAESIIKVIKESLLNWSTTAELKKEKNIMEELEVHVTSPCKEGEEKADNICKGIEPGDEVDFFINIKLKRCPGPEQQYTLNFTLISAAQSSFVIDLNFLCQCECDQKPLANADECNNKGDLTCGSCNCYVGFAGEYCNCMAIKQSDEDMYMNCINPNSLNNLTCSGQGQCTCGQCKCNENSDPEKVISGKYCQCTNYKHCYSANGLICSGQGDCKCDNCICNSGWTGKFCDCEDSTTGCRQSDQEEICSGHGKCSCNRCECEEDYLGRHCEDCKNCQAKCEEHKSCVECYVFDGGKQCEANCASYNVTLVDELPSTDGLRCSVTDENNCKSYYQFMDKNEEILVWAENSQHKVCFHEINVWAVVASVVATVVVVGLLLLIACKLIKDKREYQAFINSRNLAVWTENVSPLYKSPVSKVANPLYESSDTVRLRQ